jgi:hypothetical protein
MTVCRPTLPGAAPEWEPVVQQLRRLGAKAAAERLREDVPRHAAEAQARIRAARAETRDAREWAARLQADLHSAWAERDAALAIRADRQRQALVIPAAATAKRAATKRAVVPILLLSDWHVAEIVEKTGVHGLNESNPKIMERRVAAIGRAAVSVLRQMQEWARTEEMVIHLGGDFVTGFLHPELAETNAMAPIEEVRFARRLLAGLLEFLHAHANVRRFHVICTRGNHGRLTKKKQYKNAAGTNLENGLYWDLADRFPERDGWRWLIPQSGLGYVHLDNPDGSRWTLRAYHGEQCRYSGGIGGLTIPLNKLQARWNETTAADFNVMGHFHTFSRPNPRTLVNGSLKGFDEYALEHGFAIEPPIQTLAVYDPRWKMVSTVHPLFADR